MLSRMNLLGKGSGFTFGGPVTLGSFSVSQDDVKASADHILLSNNVLLVSHGIEMTP